MYDSYADGVNLDFEDPVDAGSPQEHYLTLLSKDLAESVHSLVPGSQVITYLSPLLSFSLLKYLPHPFFSKAQPCL